ncbi:MAG TPA: endonuclease III [Treponemataceae bacterium]|jgi:endonuclease-3|nr:endonuclease III [Treponemataceae bacterium]
MIELLNAVEITKIFELFKADKPEPKTELIAPNDFTLLVSVVLSAQATDKSVNKATAPLYAAADTPEKILSLGEDGLREYIKTIGLYRVKARHVIALCQMLIEKYNSKVPLERTALESLPGVGRKTANVILNVLAGELTMPVDTHLLRIAPRIGLSDGTNPLQVEKDLLARIPESYLTYAHHWLVLHGRYICTARKPRCADCIIAEHCKKNGVEQ